MDPKTAKVLTILPTFGRAHSNIPRFFKAAAETGMTIPGYLVVDEADYAKNVEVYDALELPDNWSIHLVQGGGCAIATEQAYRALITDDTDAVFWLADDLIPETPQWDVRCIEQLNGWNFVSTNDAAHAPAKANGATVWSGDLIRAIGYFAPPGAVHMYIDDLVEEVGRATGCWHCDMSILVRHENAAWSGAKDTTFAKTNAHWPEDDRAFQAWKRDEKHNAVNRVLALMESKGVEMTRPNLAGMRIMIAVPCGDGRYESVFLNSLRATESAVKFFGGETSLMEMNYCSDIALARSRLLGAFIRSDATHMFWIDSDQGFETKDFIRLLLAQKDFVAVAGIRKVFPASFGVNVSDEFGNAIPITEDATSGLLRASGVGLAFACMTRACATRLVQHYADLAYTAADGREEWAVFNPMVKNRRYLGEDFALCQRWRDIGGEIWIAPEVSLKHVGSFCWQGAWLEQLVEKSRAA